MGDENVTDPPHVHTPPRLSIMPPVTEVTRLSANGTTRLTVTPPLPCGLTGCIAELHVGVGANVPTRVHLNGEQVAQLVVALGGSLS
jgi:hypothetical protein